MVARRDHYPGPGGASVLVGRMYAAVGVFSLGGYHQEAGLAVRQARDRGYASEVIANSAMALEDFR